MRLAIVADDLTGACDAAVPFAARGLGAVVLLELPDSDRLFDGEVAVLAIDVDSRRLSRRTAATRTAAAARAARAGGATTLFKKVDSTLRGHVAAEIAACRRAWGAELAVLCPAFPTMGRRVEYGRLLVEGRGEIGAVADLAGLDPARTAHLSVNDLERGGSPAAATLERFRRSGARVAIADATEPRHLATLVEAAGRLAPAPLLAGSGGLAAALAGSGDGAELSPSGESSAPSPVSHLPSPAPWLVVAGSQTEATAAQIAELERAGATVIPLDLDELLARRRLTERAGGRAARSLAQGIVPILRLIVRPDAGAPAHDPRVEDRAARALGRACRTAVGQRLPGGLFLTGGLTARACLRALGAHALRLEVEPLPGIAHSRAIGGAWDSRPVITKAGGFGAPDAIRRLVEPGDQGQARGPAPTGPV